MRHTFRGFLLALLIAIPMLIGAQGCRERDRSMKRYHSLLKDGVGLNENAHVFIAGVPVGKILRRSVRNNKAKIDFTVDRQQKIFTNAVVSIKHLFPTGKRYLEIRPGTPYSPSPSNPKGPPIKNRLLKGGDRIVLVVESWDSGDLAQVMRKVMLNLAKGKGCPCPCPCK